MQSLAGRMIGAAGFSSRSYEEVEADFSATRSAIGVVLVSSLAAAVGIGATSPREIAGVLVVSVLSWLVWVVLTLFIGTRLLPGRATDADFGQILRTTGFSASVNSSSIRGIARSRNAAIYDHRMDAAAFVVAIRHALTIRAHSEL
jgi:hypothetical protein